MTSDDQITADLAVVARASKARTIALAETLRGVGIAPRVPSVVAMSTVFASRVARIVTSVYVLALVVATYLPLVVVGIDRDDYDEGGLVVSVFSRNAWSFALAIGFSAVIVHVIAWTRAAHRFEREIARGHELVSGVERWSTTLTIAAIVSYVTLFGLLRVAIGDRELNELRQPGLDFDDFVVTGPSWWWTHRAFALGGMGGAILASVGGAIVVARRQWSVTVGVAGAIGLVTTILIGFRYDTGPTNLTFSSSMLPSYPFRAVLLVTGMLSLFAIVGSYVSARGRRERAAIDGE